MKVNYLNNLCASELTLASSIISVLTQDPAMDERTKSVPKRLTASLDQAAEDWEAPDPSAIYAEMKDNRRFDDCCSCVF